MSGRAGSESLPFLRVATSLQPKKGRGHLHRLRQDDDSGITEIEAHLCALCGAGRDFTLGANRNGAVKRHDDHVFGRTGVDMRIRACVTAIHLVDVDEIAHPLTALATCVAGTSGEEANLIAMRRTEVLPA